MKRFLASPTWPLLLLLYGMQRGAGDPKAGGRLCIAGGGRQHCRGTPSLSAKQIQNPGLGYAGESLDPKSLHELWLDQKWNTEAEWQDWIKQY